MRAGIVAQRENAHAVSLAADVEAVLAERDAVAVFDAATAAALDGPSAESFDDCELVVSIGGDGTFLFAARRAGTTPVLGVNLGEVGFLNAVAPGEAVSAVEEELRRFREDGAVRSHPIPRLRASDDGDGGWTLAPAINEVAISGARRGRGAGIDLEIRVDGDLYAATRADGVMVATPTGSTAYNLSEGGPLIRPGAGALVVTPMAPAAATRPLVSALDSRVTVRVEDAEQALVAADAADRRWFTPPTQVRVRRAEKPARVAGPGVEFFRALGKLE